jgi:hypothetical protein
VVGARSREELEALLQPLLLQVHARLIADVPEGSPQFDHTRHIVRNLVALLCVYADLRHQVDIAPATLCAAADRLAQRAHELNTTQARPLRCLCGR